MLVGDFVDGRVVRAGVADGVVQVAASARRPYLPGGVGGDQCRQVRHRRGEGRQVEEAASVELFATGEGEVDQELLGGGPVLGEAPDREAGLGVRRRNRPAGPAGDGRRAILAASSTFWSSTARRAEMALRMEGSGSRGEVTGSSTDPPMNPNTSSVIPAR